MAVRAVLALTVVVALAACGGSSEPSGTYEASLPGGGGVRIVFLSDHKATVTLFEGQEEISHNTVYTKDGTKLHFTTDEPMGVPMALVYEDGVLSDGEGLVFRKK